jgi:hypothetical protein
LFSIVGRIYRGAFLSARRPFRNPINLLTSVSTRVTGALDCLQRADSCFPTSLRAEALDARVLVRLKGGFEACVSNAWREIFRFHMAFT